VTGDEAAGILAERRRCMVAEQIASRGVEDREVLAALRAVPRHLFVPENLVHDAYRDCALPIGYGQTISQPYIVALMTSLLRLDVRSRVLEVGSGSGYQTAVLAELAGEVFTIERVPELGARAQMALRGLGYRNVTTRVGDGSLGLPEHQPYTGIIVTAAAPEPPKALLHQMADGGRVVLPVGEPGRDQMLVLMVRQGDSYTEMDQIGCRFVPLVGEQGFAESS
jgi:protein-L-isoaspartate(D-aspartate) O-methyltransferase